MKIKLFANKDFLKDGFINPIWNNCQYTVDESNGNMIYNGFHYWTLNNIYDAIDKEKSFFIFAYENKFAPKNIVGVMKYGFYHDHVGICFIDVRKDKKHSGIGTKLLQFFNSLEFDGKEVYCSYFSDECLSTEFFKKVFVSLTNHDVLYDYRGYILKGTNKFVDVDKITEIPNPWLDYK